MTPRALSALAAVCGDGDQVANVLPRRASQVGGLPKSGAIFAAAHDLCAGRLKRPLPDTKLSHTGAPPPQHAKGCKPSARPHLLVRTCRVQVRVGAAAKAARETDLPHAQKKKIAPPSAAHTSLSESLQFVARFVLGLTVVRSLCWRFSLLRNNRSINAQMPQRHHSADGD